MKFTFFLTQQLLLVSLLPLVASRSVLSRYFSGEDGVPLVRNVNEDARVSDADVGMKSDMFIGTFGNQPIVTRQVTSFVDQDGVPVPILPYHETKLNPKEKLEINVEHSRHSDPTVYSKFMERHGWHF